MASSAASKTILRCRKSALLQANLGVLGQKLDLMAALEEKLGTGLAQQKFAQKCPIVEASIGQHFRHSMDHMERVANSLLVGGDNIDNDNEIHYDIRVRGGNDEHDMTAAKERIHGVSSIFQNEIDKLVLLSDHANTNAKQTNNNNNNNNKDVLACFFLSGDSEDEFLLPSTIERELGFVAHHAIHHLAMVKIIALRTLALNPPEGFGKAPSTIVYDNKNKNSNNP